MYSGRRLVPGQNASLDHLVPRSRGGTDTLENLQWVDLKVNLMKTDLMHDEFLALCAQICATHGVKTGVVDDH